MKLTLDRKILGGFLICSLILLVVAVFSFKTSEQFIDTYRLVNHSHEVLYEFEQILVNSINAETSCRGYVITGNEEFQEPFTEAKAEISRHIERARKLTGDNPEQQVNIEKIEKIIEPRLKHLEECIMLRKTQGFEKAQALVATGRGKALQDELREILANVKVEEQALLGQRRQASEDDAANFNLIFVLLLVIITVILIAVYFIVITNLRALREAQAETAAKNWSLTASSELIKDLQGNKRQDELAQITISHLATYLNAQVGAMYIMEENNRRLRLASGYGKVTSAQEVSSIRIGDGLSGQAVVEKKRISINNISDEHFNLTSTFGEIKPKTIFAVPFLFENKVTGVIELGTIHDFTEFQMQYVDLVADSIAIAITSSQVREEARELLEETQRQAEEMEVQQQELKQANEELHAKTEMLERSEAELRAQQEELQQTNEELELKAKLLSDQKVEIENKAHEIQTTSKYKSEFLANMSHELRTPLNSILILAQLLSENKNNTLAEKDIEFARNIYNSGSDLLNLINEILDLSKVEAGKLQLDIAEIPFQSISHNLLAMFSEVAKNKSINFSIRFNDKALPSAIISDKQRIEQILKNLLSNAFKFTDHHGTITLKVDKPSPSISFKNENLKTIDRVVAFSVTDTGIGIPEDKREGIFKAFQQVDGSTKRKYGGTGLGLSISLELSHALGGEIQLESTEGKGSTFTLYLPLEFDPALITKTNKQIEIKESIPHETKKENNKPIDVHLIQQDGIDDREKITENDRVILIIEDDEVFAKVLLDLVRESKGKGIITQQGNTALSYARHFRPYAIFLDMNLPVMDGGEVLKQLKNDPELRHIPILIISQYNRRIEGLALGAFDYLQKPITPSDFLNAFDKLQEFVNKTMKKVLIIEDNEEQNKAIKELIGNGDVKSSSAYSGKEAYAKLQSGSFDCIIVDLGLPDMSGFDLLEKIRANDKLNKIPIIVYTGRDLQKEDNLRLNKLADTVVLKTADSHERLLDEAMLFLHRVESRLPKEKQNIIRKLHQADKILKGKTVLLADDDIRNIYSLTNALEDEGIKCLTAETGKAAITLLKDNLVDLVLMDVMMPEMDGYEATIEIRKIKELSKLPIIALTAKAMKGDKEKCLAVGMSDYISKPINVEHLLSLMRVWLYR